LHPINEDALELSKAGLSSIINIRKSGDSVARFVVTTDGALSWGDGSGLPDVGLRRTGTNQLELDAGDHLRLPTCADLQQTGPAGVFTPQTGWSRLYAGSLGRLYAITESSKTHDLCAQHKQTIPGVSLAANASGQCSWQSSKHPGSATSAALVSVSQAFSYDFANGGVGTCRGTWTVAADGTSGLVQSQIATGTPFRKYGDGLDRDNNSRAVIKALVRLSDPASLDDLRLFLNDEDGNLASSNVLSQLTSNSWAEVTLDDSGTDTSTWDTALYAGLWARGSSTLTTADTWSIDVKWLSIEQWCG